jgi:broad specificity phosphatase PhoE
MFGKKQAEAIARRMKKETFDRIYTSDLKRAVQVRVTVAVQLLRRSDSFLTRCRHLFKTTEEIKKHHPNVPQSVDQRLREQVRRISLTYFLDSCIELQLTSLDFLHTVTLTIYL